MVGEFNAHILAEACVPSNALRISHTFKQITATADNTSYTSCTICSPHSILETCLLKVDISYQTMVGRVVVLCQGQPRGGGEGGVCGIKVDSVTGALQ